MNETRRKTQPSIRYAACPHHVAGASAPTGVIRRNDGTEIFRPHTKKVGRTTIQCPGSGQIAPPTEGNQP